MQLVLVETELKINRSSVSIELEHGFCQSDGSMHFIANLKHCIAGCWKMIGKSCATLSRESTWKNFQGSFYTEIKIFHQLHTTQLWKNFLGKFPFNEIWQICSTSWVSQIDTWKVSSVTWKLRRAIWIFLACLPAKIEMKLFLHIVWSIWMSGKC